MPSVMRAVDVRNGAGPASSLFINDATPVPAVLPGEVLVRVKAFGINRGDILQRDGKYPGIAHLSKIMGLEFSGVIAELREDEPEGEWKVGDEVFGLLYGGGYAEYVNVNKQMLIRKPKELSFEETGGLCEAWFVALQALYLVGAYTPEKTRSILWHAAASSVSVAGIQLSAHANPSAPPKVFATARKDDKCEFAVTNLGATAAVNMAQHPDKRSWAGAVKALNGGQGVDLVVDFLGGPYIESNLDVLAIDGSIVQLGWLGGPITEGSVNIACIMTKRARVQGSQLRSRDLEYQVKVKEFFLEKVLPGLVDGRLKHVVDKVVPWERVQEAHELMESNQVKGKIVCVIE